jgi:non-specific serine/threonine protein kinase
VARSLGLSDQSARWAVAALSDCLAGRQLLLVLDQCEHLADACAVMADALLREAALVSLLTGVGMAAGPAFSAVLLYRLATYWLPVAPGWLSWRVLQRREYV